MKTDEGIASKEQLTKWIHENTTLTAGDYWDNYYAIQNFTLSWITGSLL